MDSLTTQRPIELCNAVIANGIALGVITDDATLVVAEDDLNALFPDFEPFSIVYADWVALGDLPQKENTPTGGDAWVAWMAAAS